MSEQTELLPVTKAVNRIIEMVLVAVSELPDRSYPDDEPDMMLVTSDELDAIIRRAFEYVASTTALQQRVAEMEAALWKVASGCTASSDDISNATVMWMQHVARQALSENNHVEG